MKRSNAGKNLVLLEDKFYIYLILITVSSNKITANYLLVLITLTTAPCLTQ